MKKIALLLALVMTLGVASMASAAEVTTSGEVSYTVQLAPDFAFDSTDFKLKVGATINDQVSAAIRLRPTTVLGSDGLTAVKGVKVDQANVTLKYAPVSVTLGLGSVVNDPFSTDGFGFIPGRYDMINVKTDSFNGVTAQLIAVPATEGAFQGLFVNYAPEFGSFGLIVRPSAVADKYDFAVNAKAAIPSTPVTALAEVTKAEGLDPIYAVGAEATLAGIDTYVYYFTAPEFDTNSVKYGASKEVNGVTYAVDFETANDTTTGTAGVTVAF